ncbi:MAG: alpha/beta fold hydrolase [Gammaproteobacteria bacterium]|nr:alpha/beta fold hydrolase [Gammaproteobacteria bacterium]
MELNFTQFSDTGKPLIILHGLFGNLKNWNWQARELAADFSVYALDLRNHGESPHSNAMDYQVMADDVLEFIESNALEEVYLLGHSMGGKVAMQLALDNPHRVNKLLVADIAPVAYGEERGDHENVFDGLMAVDVAELQSRGEAEAALAPHVAEPAVRQFLVSNLVKDERGGYRWRFNLSVLYHSYDRLREGVIDSGIFDKPVLFVKGDNSNYIEKEDWPAIERLFPAARIKTVMGAGHWLHAEKPKVFYKLARDFFGGGVR